MADYHLGENCDLILIHEDVNNGEPYGFVLSPSPSDKSRSISIQRQLDDEGATSIYIFASIIMADDLKNPDGSEHTDRRQTMYNKLLDYLNNLTGISVGSVMGTYLGLGQIGHSTTELHLIDATYISLKLTNITAYNPPVDSEIFFASEWQPDPANAEALTWETSVWR